MPKGKNSIKRVANNGYSNVKTNSPDMENSEVLEATKETKKSAPKKSTAKKPAAPAAKKAPAKKPSSVKEANAPKKEQKEKAIAEAEKSYFNVGDALPIYLL